MEEETSWRTPPQDVQRGKEMEEGTQVKKVIPINHTDWQDPELHAHRALDALQKLEDETYRYTDSIGHGVPEYLEKAWSEVREEIENLYHSFYVR